MSPLLRIYCDNGISISLVSMVILCILLHALENIICQAAKGFLSVNQVKDSNSKGKERRGDLYPRNGNVVYWEYCFLEHGRDLHIEIPKEQGEDFERQGP